MGSKTTTVLSTTVSYSSTTMNSVTPINPNSTISVHSKTIPSIPTMGSTTTPVFSTTDSPSTTICDRNYSIPHKSNKKKSTFNPVLPTIATPEPSTTVTYPSNSTDLTATVKSATPTQFEKIILRIHLFIRILSLLFYFKF
jgi:hypothetical protein